MGAPYLSRMWTVAENVKEVWMKVLLAIALALAAMGCSRDAPAQGPITHNSVKLSWTAPGDDGDVGRASVYDLRYSSNPITDANFSTAARWLGMPLPSPSGQRDSVTVGGLSPSTLYYFALKSADEVPNWSGISNIITATTLPAPDVNAPAAIRDLKIGTWLARLPPLALGVRW